MVKCSEKWQGATQSSDWRVGHVFSRSNSEVASALVTLPCREADNGSDWRS